MRAHVRHPLLLGVTSAFLLLGAGPTGCATTPPVFVNPPPGSPLPLIMGGGITPDEARGVWRSRGYGLLLTVTENSVRLHHETKAGCYADPGGEDSLLSSLTTVVPDEDLDEDELAIVSDLGETRYLFDRIKALPPACESTAPWTSRRVFDVFTATFTEHYAFFEEYGHPWEARVAALRPKVTDALEPRALFGLLTQTLKGLEDAHTGLSAELDGETLTFSEGKGGTTKRVLAAGQQAGLADREAQRAWLHAYRDGILQTVLNGQGHHVANSRVFHGLIGGDVGYLNVVTMGGFVEGEPTLKEERRALDAVLVEAVKSFQGARAVIVDVSNNRGGHDAIARDIAARFAARRRLAYTKRPRQVDMEPQAFYVEPASGPRFIGPVYVLTSDITVSAGEVFTLAMRALPNVTHVGTATRGAFSDVLVKPLPNGWRMELSNELYLDSQGKLFEARGIPPQEPLDVFPGEDLQGGHARAVLRLAELARQRAASAPAPRTVR